MDENSNINEVIKQPIEDNPFKNKRFYFAYLATIIVYAVISLLLPMTGGEYWIIGTLLLCIPYAIVGIIVWAITRKKTKAVALGILFGSLTPFVVMFIVTGGCGLFRF